MPLYRAEAIVLHSRELGEADRLVTLFSREEGKVHAVAKGARKVRSRLAAATQPLTHAGMLLYRGRQLDIVSQCEIHAAFPAIRTSLLKTAYAACMAELVDETVKERDRQDGIFYLLLAVLHLLEEAEEEGCWRLFHAFQLRLLGLVGYRPRVRECAACGGECASREVGFSPRAGGVLCCSCRALEPGAMMVRRGTIAAMAYLLEADMRRLSPLRLTVGTAAEVETALESYVSFYLEKRLRAMDFLKRVRGQDLLPGGPPYPQERGGRDGHQPG